MNGINFVEGIQFKSLVSGESFEVVSVKKAILTDAVNVTIRNLRTKKKSVHGLKYLERIAADILEE